MITPKIAIMFFFKSNELIYRKNFFFVMNLKYFSSWLIRSISDDPDLKKVKR